MNLIMVTHGRNKLIKILTMVANLVKPTSSQHFQNTRQASEERMKALTLLMESLRMVETMDFNVTVMMMYLKPMTLTRLLRIQTS